MRHRLRPTAPFPTRAWSVFLWLPRDVVVIVVIPSMGLPVTYQTTNAINQTAAVFDRMVVLTEAIEAAAGAVESDGVPMATYLEARMLAHNTTDGLAEAVTRARALVAAEVAGR